MARLPTTYWDYIRVHELTALQGGLEADERELSNDEVMFITIHQIDELWFKLALRELITVRDLFKQARVPEQSLAAAARSLRRVALIFELASQHFALMETMTTRDYLAFRDKLVPASGFQSFQLREIEVLMGLRDEERIAIDSKSYIDALRLPDGSESEAFRRVLHRRADRPSLKEAIDAWLYRTPINGSTPDQAGDEAVVRSFIESYLQAHAGEIDRLVEMAAHEGMGPEDKAKLRERYLREKASAKEFLEAKDHPEEERFRVSRIRAALLFIESYRELPLLAFPREVLDALIAMEQSM
ncbi:MAG: tryptophan 2,3-dioxygenase family protein, partial [Deltaproteobacteria bacterium]|nr:tryptophan 2,3-dioxygenase family protein [Deltaproteobacteria bacterium]